MAFSFSAPTPIFQSSQTLTLTPAAAQQQTLPFFAQGHPSSFSQPQLQPSAPSPQQMYLFTNDRSPASYSTKFEDLHPDSQKFLLKIQERIKEYKDECHRLEQNSRLFDSSMSSDSFELDANRILQELGGISIAMDREKVIVQELMSEVKSMMWNTEVAVRSYMILRTRFLRANASSSPGGVSASNALAAPISSSSFSQLTDSAVVPIYDFYSGIPKKPSPFMQFTLARFEKYVAECRQWVEELEQLVLLDSEKNSLNLRSSSLQFLPNIMSNVHDFFVHVAAKVESLHLYIESMKSAYLADQRRHGDGGNPFLEADRREAAKQEAAARRVHPTLHLPAISAHPAISAQPATQGAGLFASSMSSASSAPQQTIMSPVPSSAAAGFSSFGPMSSTSATMMSMPFLLSTPTATASGSNFFGSSGFSPQPTSFGSASTSLFGSSPAPSLFGATSTPSFTSTPAIGGGPSGSGASFGAASKSARPKSRAARR